MAVLDTCTFCHQKLNLLKPWRFHTFILSQLQRSVDEGCRTCMFSQKAIHCFTADQEARVLFQEEPKRFRIGRKFYEVFRVGGECLPEGRTLKGGRELRGAVAEAAQVDDSLTDINYGNLLSSKTSSEETFQAIRTWLEGCVAGHSACVTRDFSPKRVLDVRFDRVVLLEDAVVSRYACLSHCWGPPPPPIRTVSENMQDFMSEIPWEKLSKTFQDAVDICRRLDIAYIWIDSLCIIQDSEDDWKNQSVQMADIYENAVVTIAATKSKDGLGGCYSDRDPGHANAQPIVEGQLYAREQMPKLKLETIDNDQLPLLSRGWVYQEMTLSPRVLHFCRQEVIWSCRTHTKSESGANDKDRQTSWDTGTKGYATSDLLWYNAVNKYTHLALTKERDRLPALAAVAQREARSRPADDRYLAGLWQSTLRWDLLWQTYPPTTRDRPAARPRVPEEVPEEWRPPSWSWASVRTHTQWFALLRYNARHAPLTCTRLRQVDVVPASAATEYLGQYQRARLVFHGPLLTTTLGEMETMATDYPDRDANLELDEHISVHEFVPDCTWPSSGPGSISKEQDIRILPLMVSMAGKHQTHALALLNIGARDTYERIGLVELNYLRGIAPSVFEGTLTDAGRNLEGDYLSHGRLEGSRWVDAYLCTLPSFEVIIQ